MATTNHSQSDTDIIRPFFLGFPAVKVKGDEKGEIVIVGVASDPGMDAQDEVIKGWMDSLPYLVQFGQVDWDHHGLGIGKIDWAKREDCGNVEKEFGYRPEGKTCVCAQVRLFKPNTEMEPMQLRDLQTARGTALAGGRLGFSMVGSRVTPAVNQVEGKTVVQTRAFATGLSLTPHPINPRAAARVLRVEKGMGLSAEVPFRFVKSIGQLITGEEQTEATGDEEEVVADVYECQEARKSMGSPAEGIVGAVRSVRTAMQVAETMRVVKGVRRAHTRTVNGKTVQVAQASTKVNAKADDARTQAARALPAAKTAATEAFNAFLDAQEEHKRLRHFTFSGWEESPECRRAKDREQELRTKAIRLLEERKKLEAQASGQPYKQKHYLGEGDVGDVSKGVRRATTRHLASGKTVPVRQTTTKVEKKPGEAGAKRLHEAVLSAHEAYRANPKSRKLKSAHAAARDAYGAALDAEGVKPRAGKKPKPTAADWDATSHKLGMALNDAAKATTNDRESHALHDAGARAMAMLRGAKHPTNETPLLEVLDAIQHVQRSMSARGASEAEMRGLTAADDLHRQLWKMRKQGIQKSAVFSAGSGTAPATFTGGESLRVDNMTKTKKRLKQVRRAVRRVEKIITTLAGAGRPEGGTK